MNTITTILYDIPAPANAHLILVDEIGDGEVHVGENFLAIPPLQQADLLQDWIIQLQEMYDMVTSGDLLPVMGILMDSEPPTGSSH